MTGLMKRIRERLSRPAAALVFLALAAAGPACFKATIERVEPIFGHEDKTPEPNDPLGRVAAARSEKQALVQIMFEEAGVDYPPWRVLLRNFKMEAELELWAKGQNDGQYRLVHVYPVCKVPGKLGPKRRQGDRQVPEGIYAIDAFNPESRNYVSMRVSYPNSSDRILGHPESPGGDIYIHGGCSTIGCIPVTDDYIKELYLVCADSKRLSGADPLFHGFPCRMDSHRCKRALARRAGDDPAAGELWQALALLYDDFENSHEPSAVTVARDGAYRIR